MAKNTLQNAWTLVSLSSAIDRDNNTLSLFDVLEELTLQVTGTVPENAMIPVNHHLLSLWAREEIGEPVSLKFKVLLRDPAGKVLHENSAEVSLEGKHKRTRFRAQFNGFPVTTDGTYHYEIISLEPEKTDGKELVRSVPIDVRFVQQPVKSPLSP